VVVSEAGYPPAPLVLLTAGKDLTDITRLVEAHPELRDDASPEIASQLD